MEARNEERDWGAAQSNLQRIWGALESAGITRNDGRRIAHDFFLWSQSRPPSFEEHGARFFEFLRVWFRKNARPLPDTNGTRDKLMALLESNPLYIPKRLMNGNPIMPFSIDPDVVDFEELYSEFLVETDADASPRNKFPLQFSEGGTRLKILQNANMKHLPVGCQCQLAAPLKYGKEISLVLESGHCIWILGVVSDFTLHAFNEIEITIRGRFIEDGMSVGGDLKKITFQLRGDNGDDTSVDLPPPSRGDTLPIGGPVLAL